MFPDEFALAQRFSGVMVDPPGTAEGGGAIRGLKSACGYTIIGTPWLEKPGGAESLKHWLVKMPEISLLPCNNRIIIKSGELAPPLGEIKTEGLSPLLVKINQLIKSVRFNGTHSLHFCSGDEYLQFDKESTMRWYRRFDEASDLADKEEQCGTCKPVHITHRTDETALFAGQWAAIVNGATEYIHTSEGQKMLVFEDKYGNRHHACWSLLKRDDDGGVYISQQEEYGFYPGSGWLNLMAVKKLSGFSEIDELALIMR